MNKEYTRLENELEEELIYRICSEKDIIGTWNDVADVLNRLLGYEYTESKYRKVYQGFKKIIEANQSIFISDDSQIEELRRLKNEIQEERYKLQATKIEDSRYKRQDSRFSLFYENIQNAKERLVPPTLMYSPTVFDNYKEYLLGIGDLHYGAKFKSVNNEYSRDECKRRFEILLEQLVSYIKKEELSRLKIVNVGDTLQGILRMTDLQINEIPVTECVVEVSRLLATFLNELSAYCDITYYHVPRANHTQTRNLGTKASELANEDLETVIVSYISDLLANNNSVEVISDIKSDHIDFDISGFKCITLHGHQIKNTKTVIRDLSSLHRKFYSYCILGHTHASNEMIVGEECNNNIEVLTVPSFIGSDPYSDSLMLGAKAMAKMYVFDEKYGHIESRNFILN